MSYGEHTDEITCPFCNSSWTDSWEVESDKEDIGLLECDECGKSFYCTRNIEVTYSSKEAEYGTCLRCGLKNVVIENLHSSIGEYKSLCVKCGEKEYKRLVKAYSDDLKQFRL